MKFFSTVRSSSTFLVVMAMASIGGGANAQTTPTYAPSSDGTATNTNEGTTGAGSTTGGGDTAGAASISTSSTMAAATISTSTGATMILTTTAAASASSNTETESWMVCSKELATSTSLNMGALTFYHYVALAPEGDARKGILCGRLERSDGTAGWIGFGMSPDGEMDNGIGIIGLPSSSSDGGSGSVEKYWLSGEDPFVERMSDDKQTLQFASITQNADDGSTVMEFAKFLNEEDELPILLAGEGENTFLFALGGSNELGYHSSGMGSFTLALEASEASSSSTTTGTTTTATSATTASTSFAIEGEFLFFLQCHHIYDCLFFYTYASNHSMIF